MLLWVVMFSRPNPLGGVKIAVLLCFFKQSNHMKPSSQPECQSNLRYQDQWHSQHKIPVLGFMMPNIHAQPGAKTSSCQRRRKQSMLRYTPAAFLRTSFICRHKTKCHQIGKRQIQQPQFHNTITTLLPRRPVSNVRALQIIPQANPKGSPGGTCGGPSATVEEPFSCRISVTPQFIILCIYNISCTPKKSS